MSAVPPASTCSSEQWRQLRSRLVSRLSSEASRGLVDPDILPVLEALNSVPCIVTSSSCSGRIAVFSAPSPGDKRRGGIVAKWHRRVTVKELREATRLASGRFAWVSAQPVILAFHSCSLAAAQALVEAAEAAGFKYAGYRFTHVSYYGIIKGAERVDLPLEAVSAMGLGQAAALLNEYLTLTKARLERLKRAVASVLPVLSGACDEATLS